MIEKLIEEMERTGKGYYKRYALYRTRTGWRTYPGYDAVRFATLALAMEAIDGWVSP